jgi:hypothetical protein
MINFKAVQYALAIQKEEINHSLKTIKTEIILSSILLCYFFHISCVFIELSLSIIYTMELTN